MRENEGEKGGNIYRLGRADRVVPDSRMMEDRSLLVTGRSSCEEGKGGRFQDPQTAQTRAGRDRERAQEVGKGEDQ